MAFTDKSFLEKLKPYVIEDMKHTGILASLTAAQAFIESNKGNSGLTTQCNNLFGIKGTYNGEFGLFWTTEYYNGVKQRVQAKFKKYPSWQESITDHSSLFNRLARYKNLRGETNYIKACENVMKDGYATAPDYTQTLLSAINRYKLYEWDSEVLGKVITPTEKEIKKSTALPTLRYGDKNDYVLNWQKFLNLNGYPCGKEDGKFGMNTLTAVKSWQENHNLEADGVIGAFTWASIGVF